ncbi:MAG TPA: cohesin domain-containing protein [Candidatus Limnocylindrales bacterium]|nr:cohesin domain-containing protein [Candidatus Limnocylindrales bacterium]
MKNAKAKKFFAVTMIACLLIVLALSQVASAQTGVLLTTSEETGIVGDQVIVTINIANALGTQGGQFDLSFDPARVRPVSAARGAFVPDISGNIFDHNLNLEPGKLRVLWVTAAGSTSASGVIGTITFDLLAAGDSALTFRDVTVSPTGTTVAPTVVGEIAVITEAAAKTAAINAAINAIAALPTVDSLTLDNKPAVVAARALVTLAKTDHGAVDADITNLSRLVASENRIRELEGQQPPAPPPTTPTPPTGGLQYQWLAGLLAMGSGALVYVKRKRLA